MARTLSVALLFAAALPAFAQRVAIDPPLVGRPEEFSNIVGQYTIAVSAEPLEVPVEEPITLRIRITGVGPQKYEPKRESLRILPNLSDDFYVENVIDEDRVMKDEKTWLFVYRLRPKHVNVKEIDGLKFIYYDPEYRGKTKFVPRPIDPIAITVKPKRDLTGKPETPTAVPDSFYQIDDSLDVLARSSPFAVSPVALMLTLTIPPLACMVGVLAWRRVFPAESQRKARHRRQSAKRALGQLRGSEPAWIILRRYLHERFDFAVDDPTPMDVFAFFKRRGFAKERCQDAAAFFSQCDAVRYTDRSIDSKPLSDSAVCLIQALEADPCAR
jgi:hypothetical protein